jgi:hypothetical protein
VSDDEGRFQVAGLTAGTYRVMAALAGFETTTQFGTFYDSEPRRIRFSVRFER